MTKWRVIRDWHKTTGRMISNADRASEPGAMTWRFCDPRDAEAAVAYLNELEETLTSYAALTPSRGSTGD